MSPRAGLDEDRILQAALALAEQDGFEAVTLGALAGRLGVRTPSLYNHIEGLPALRSRMAAHVLEKLTDLLAGEIRGKTGHEAVRALALAYFAYARAHPGLYESTLRAPDAGDARLERAAGRLVELAAGAFAGCGLAGDAAIHAVRGFRSMLHGFAALERAGGFGMPQRIGDSFAWMIDTYLAGIRAGSGEDGNGADTGT